MARRRVMRMGICALILALAVVGCGREADLRNPNPVVSSAASNPGEPAPQAPLPAQPADPTPTVSARVATFAARPSLIAKPEQRDAGASGPAAISTSQPANQPTSQPGPQLAGTESRRQPTVEVTTPTPTPRLALRRLTTGGCCTQPFWSPDSRQVLFIDKPAPDAPVGIWGVDVAQPGSTPELVSERIGFYTADMAFLVELSPGTTIIERTADPLTGTGGARWTVSAEGRPVSFSPGRKRIAWQVSNDAPFERRMTQVWVANLDGTDARPVATLPRGSLSGWISDDRVLLSSREALRAREQVLYTLSLTDDAMVELVRSERLRGSLLSPDGRWLAYYVALSDEPAQNGLWLVRTDGSARRKLDRDLFGAYQWRDAGRLLIIPFRPEVIAHELWEFNVASSETRRLTDPDVIPFKIANGDWQVSPDGRYIAFVESRDHNIWVLELD